MPSKSEFLEKAKEEANAAFDEHCKQWELLQQIVEPTTDDLENWLSARDVFYKARNYSAALAWQLSLK